MFCRCAVPSPGPPGSGLLDRLHAAGEQLAADNSNTQRTELSRVLSVQHRTELPCSPSAQWLWLIVQHRTELPCSPSAQWLWLIAPMILTVLGPSLLLRAVGRAQPIAPCCHCLHIIATHHGSNSVHCYTSLLHIMAANVSATLLSATWSHLARYSSSCQPRHESRQCHDSKPSLC